MPDSAAAYWVEKKGQGAIRAETLDAPGDDELRLEALASGISPGTERLVGLAALPASAYDSMRCAYMAGSFDLPVKYGYSLVGRDETSRRYFLMHPHQSALVASRRDAIAIPDELPTLRAVLFPAMETAQNALWDARLQDEDEALVVGGGLIGVMLAYLLHERGGRPVPVVEFDDERRRFLESIPWLLPTPPSRSAEPAPRCVFHCSASPRGLQWAIDESAFEARVIELSWYGSRPVSLHLGGSFHYGRKQLVSSQVAQIAAPVRGRIDRRERQRIVLSRLQSSALDQLLSPVVPFEELPHLMAAIYSRSAQTLAPVVTYENRGIP